MKAKVLGESDHFLKTKPVHNGVKACSQKVPKKKKKPQITEMFWTS